MSNRLKRLLAEQEKETISKKVKDRLQRAAKGTKRQKRKDPISMICEDFPGGLATLKLLRYNPTSGWIPKGKGKRAIFKSLIDHAIVKYPPPVFLYKMFYNMPARARQSDMGRFARLFQHLALGGSLRKVVGTDMMPAPLTKRMCHQFLNLPASTQNVVAGIRRVQVKAYGGSPSLCDAIIRSALGTFRRNEEFWATVIQWFCNQPMLDVHMVSPLVDYIQFCLNENNEFSMKGRSALAMIRGMEEWHGVLHKLNGKPGDIYEQSGLLEGTWITKKVDRASGIELKHTWTFRELTSAKALMEEGRAMRHCVYSYSRSVENGTSSIWSLRKNDERVLTIQVNICSEAICQIRGYANRMATNEEKNIVSRWATKNQLTMPTWRF